MKVNQIYSLLNTATQEVYGAQAPTVKDGSQIASLGDFILNSTDPNSKDLWLQKITDVIGKTIIRDKMYNIMQYPFMRDQVEYGALLRIIKVKSDDVAENFEWDPGNADNQFDYTPVDATEYLFQNKGTWAKTISIPDNQLKSAFQNVTEMTAFIASMYNVLETAMNLGIESLNRYALALFIAEKYNLQTTQSTKNHAINVLAEYNAATGNTLTVAEMYTDREFYRFLSAFMKEYMLYMSKKSITFNNTTYATHSSKEELDIYVNSKVSSKFSTYLESDTFHNEIVKLPNYIEVPYWQAPGLKFETAETTRVNMQLASDNLETVDVANILVAMVDREAIMTFFEDQGTESARNAVGKFTNQIRTANKSMAIDLSENGLILYAADTP